MNAIPARVLAVIPARGHSRGLPGKHLRRLGGQPVIAHTIRAALGAETIGAVLVSTDDPAIRAAAIRFGADAPFLRPAELAEDETPTAPVVWHAVRWWEESNRTTLRAVVTLQPTSPLRTAAQIDAAVYRLEVGGLDSVVSVVSTDLPVSILGTDEDGVWQPLAGIVDPRRQASPIAYRLSGGIYASRREVLSGSSMLGLRIGMLVVEPETAIDIDTPADLAEARRILRRSRTS